MAFQFPPSPAVGQTFEAAPGIVYRWNGTAWFLIAGSPATFAKYKLQEQAESYAILGFGNAPIPLDNTVPQITEGSAFFQVTITPKQIGSRLRCRHQGFWSTDLAGTQHMIAALFAGAGPDAFAVGSVVSPAAGTYLPLYLEGEIVTTSLDPLDIWLRAGSAVAGTYRLNGILAGANFGGTSMFSFLKVEEWTP